jgi:hypothetical protein
LARSKYDAAGIVSGLDGYFQNVDRRMLTIGVGGHRAGAIGIVDQDIIHSVLERRALAQIDGICQQRDARQLFGALKDRLVFGATTVVDNNDLRRVVLPDFL